MIWTWRQETWAFLLRSVSGYELHIEFQKIQCQKLILIVVEPIMTSALSNQDGRFYQRSINVYGNIFQYVDSSEYHSETSSGLCHQRRLGQFVYNKLPNNITPVKQDSK